MVKTITLDYEEFETIKEKADLKQSKIDEIINERIENYSKIIEKSRNHRYESEIEDYKSLIKKIEKKCHTDKNVFGYIKVETILNLIKEK